MLLTWKWAEIHPSTCQPEGQISTKTMKNDPFLTTPDWKKKIFPVYWQVSSSCKFPNVSNKAKLDIGSLILSQDILQQVCRMLFSTYRFKWKWKWFPGNQPLLLFSATVSNPVKRHFINADWPPSYIITKINNIENILIHLNTLIIYLYVNPGNFTFVLAKGGVNWDLSVVLSTLSHHILHTYRYIDDVLSINNHNFHNYVHLIYPDELEIRTDLLHIWIFYLILTLMADWQLHYMINVMTLTLQLSTFLFM